MILLRSNLYPLFVRLPVTNSLYIAFSSNVGAWGMRSCSLFLSLPLYPMLVQCSIINTYLQCNCINVCAISHKHLFHRHENVMEFYLREKLNCFMDLPLSREYIFYKAYFFLNPWILYITESCICAYKIQVMFANNL